MPAQTGIQFRHHALTDLLSFMQKLGDYRMSEADRIAIQFNGGPVGTLDIESLPDETGVIKYMPYRSISHYLMHCSIAEGETPTCTFIYFDKKITTFLANACTS